MLNFTNGQYHELAKNICSIYLKGFTKLMRPYINQPEAALNIIEQYEYYQKIQINELSSIAGMIKFLEKAYSDYTKYFKNSEIPVFIYSDYLSEDKLNLDQIYLQIQKALFEITLKSKTVINNNTSNNDNRTKKTSNKNIVLPQTSENYKFGAQVANQWIQAYLCKLNGKGGIRQQIKKDSLHKFLQLQSPYRDYIHGGLDEYDRIMNELSPEENETSKNSRSNSFRF